MMRTRAFLLVLIMLSSTTVSHLFEQNQDSNLNRTFEDLLAGFLVSAENEIWNETPFRDVAVPNGFDYLTVIDYSDVGVLINNNSEESKTIGWAFCECKKYFIRKHIFLQPH